MKTIFDAPITSPLSEIDAEDVALFLIQLTREDFLQSPDSQGPNVHDSLAFSLANEILSTPENRKNKLFVKLLLSLQLSANDFVKLRELRMLNDQMLEAVTDRNFIKSLQKFGLTIAAYLSKHTGAEEEEERADENKEQQEDSQDEGNSINATRASKKRQLFSQTNQTVVLSLTGPNPKRGSSDVIDSASSPATGSDDPFLPPRLPSQAKDGRKKTVKVRKVTNDVGEVTRINDTDDDEDNTEEEEELVSGNLARRKNPLIRVMSASSNESEGESKRGELKFSSAGSSSSQESSEIVVSTQKDQASESSEEGTRVMESFFGKAPGKQPRKLRKKGSPSTTTTEEEDNAEGEQDKGRKKRGKTMEKKRTVPARKASRRSAHRF